jgi:uncharacterized protein YidB (DUF937 family)
MIATFDELIQDIDSRYRLGAKAGLLVQQTLGLISGQPDGIGGFLNRFQAAGFTVEVASWLEGPDPVPLLGEEVEQTLGSDAISEIANKVGISQGFAKTILGYTLPQIIVLLTQGGSVPEAIPVWAKSFLDTAIPLSASPVKETAQHGAEQIRPDGTEYSGVSPRRASPRREQRFAYGPHAAVALCLFGFAWAAGAYFSSGQSRLYGVKPPAAGTVVPQESAERAEMSRAQKMAEDIQALKADVEALKAAQSQPGKDATAVEDLKTRLDAVKTETAASIADLAGKVEQMERKTQVAVPLAKLPLENAHGKRTTAGRSDALNPSQNPAARGNPRPLGSLSRAATRPQLITNWVVRDVYDGVALVESPRGSIEVAPGEIIPGAGTVESIERRGGGWIVITSRGLVDYAP